MHPTKLSGRQIAWIVTAALVPIAVVLAVAWPAQLPNVDHRARDASASGKISAALGAIDGVSAVEDFGATSNANGKNVHAHLVMDPTSDVGPHLVLEQGVRVLWTWPAWEPPILLSVERGEEYYGARSLVEPGSESPQLSPADVEELFGEWPGDPVPGLTQ